VTPRRRRRPVGDIRPARHPHPTWPRIQGAGQGHVESACPKGAPGGRSTGGRHAPERIDPVAPCAAAALAPKRSRTFPYPLAPLTAASGRGISAPCAGTQPSTVDAGPHDARNLGDRPCPSKPSWSSSSSSSCSVGAGSTGRDARGSTASAVFIKHGCRRPRATGFPGEDVLGRSERGDTHELGSDQGGRHEVRKLEGTASRVPVRDRRWSRRLRRQHPHRRQLHRDLCRGYELLLQRRRQLRLRLSGRRLHLHLWRRGQLPLLLRRGRLQHQLSEHRELQHDVHGEWLPHDLHRRRDLLARGLPDAFDLYQDLQQQRIVHLSIRLGRPARVRSASPRRPPASAAGARHRTGYTRSKT
jgi:hypothetical protein